MPSLVWIDGTPNGRHDPPRLGELALLDSPEQQRIEAALLIEGFNQTLLDRLHHHDMAAEHAFFVQQVNHPVGEPAQECSFAELDHGFGEVN